MKSKFVFISIILAFLGLSVASAQVESYMKLMLQGNNRIQTENYTDAIRSFEKALAVSQNDEQKSAAQNRIAYCKNCIEKKRAEAAAAEKAKQDAEKKAKQEADRKARQEAERKARLESERREREEAQRRHSQYSSVDPQPEPDAENYEAAEDSGLSVSIYDMIVMNYDAEDNVIGSSEDGVLYAEDMRWLTPVIKYSNYNGEPDAVYEVNIKVFDHTGTLKTLSKSPEVPQGFSCNARISPKGDGDTATALFSWGNDDRSVFQPGSYRIEIWYNGVLNCTFGFNLN